MAMMTGRVLLVCALCVLWCGAGGGFADKVVEAAAGVVASNRTDEENLILNWYVLTQEECANESTTGGKLNVTAERICMHKVMKGICNAFYNKTSGVTHDRDAKFICTYYATIPEEPVEPTTPQGPTSHSAVSNTTSDDGAPKNAPESDVAGRGEGKDDYKEHGNTKQKAVETAAVENDTKTTDSDVSTAVSHTTSPLFLLVVACAAAAAAVVHGLCDCVGRCIGVTNTSVWRVSVCWNDVRMTREGCCL
ncbi:Mucin-associated surface protein (MASP) [Trypanosoma cruzi]|uniref:Mucin-associated surface protein (MASP), putative n=2 Tax=Trypanosoma cruzi TaxID=5693 RepID=Q4E513_TRYCC|nr:mucin-associated surface protein (MASP), putative [Trypanosoma cruzi]EAN99856.1 mucin-associated surface protein (MASP), putative [Trypanosoma cruzi]PWV17798.1 Mucin-associated surface protein (MASP) [Trypanosoma cruzi]RNC38722.1 mucin-associated surface protein (MASP) [Trypanosoma cruzi]|eukprot:XP_821707.1 mucin-associated surface protein (MASP) [Trypanosoma cruzi strain CL Brener]